MWGCGPAGVGTGVGDGVWVSELLRVLDWIELDGAGRMTLRARSAGVGIGVRGVEGYEGCIGGLVGIVLERVGRYGVSKGRPPPLWVQM